MRVTFYCSNTPLTMGIDHNKEALRAVTAGILVLVASSFPASNATCKCNHPGAHPVNGSNCFTCDDGSTHTCCASDEICYATGPFYKDWAGPPISEGCCVEAPGEPGVCKKNGSLNVTVDLRVQHGMGHNFDGLQLYSTSNGGSDWGRFVTRPPAHVDEGSTVHWEAQIDYGGYADVEVVYTPRIPPYPTSSSLSLHLEGPAGDSPSATARCAGYLRCKCELDMGDAGTAKMECLIYPLGAI